MEQSFDQQNDCYMFTKNQIHLEKGEMFAEICKESLNREESSTQIEQESIFDKYKLGGAHFKAPFKLFETNYSTSGDQDEDDSDRNDRKMRGPYRKYTFDEKMQAVERIANGEDVKVISKQFGIPRRNLLRWKKNGCERKEGGGRPTDCEMEKVIYDKIKNQELTDEKEIRKFAIELSKTTSFKASKGWFVKFCNRFQIDLQPEKIQEVCMDGISF